MDGVREPRLSVSEMMTIIIHFHQSHYRDFKTYYIEYVCQYLIDKSFRHHTQVGVGILVE